MNKSKDYIKSRKLSKIEDQNTSIQKIEDIQNVHISIIEENQNPDDSKMESLRDQKDNFKMLLKTDENEDTGQIDRSSFDLMDSIQEDKIEPKSTTAPQK